MSAVTGAMVNAYCLQPTEIQVAQLRIEPDGSVTGGDTLVQKPGMSMGLAVVVGVDGQMYSTEVELILTRNAVEKLYEGLGTFLQDGGHYHWRYPKDEIKRKPDVAIDFTNADVQFEVADDLSGLEGLIDGA